MTQHQEHRLTIVPTAPSRRLERLRHSPGKEQLRSPQSCRSRTRGSAPRSRQEMRGGLGPAKPGCAEGMRAQSGRTRVLAPSLDPSACAGKQEKWPLGWREGSLGSGHTETRVRMLTEEFSGGRGGDPGEQPLPWKRSCSGTELGQGPGSRRPTTQQKGEGSRRRGAPRGRPYRARPRARSCPA